MGTIYKCSKAVKFTSPDNPAVTWDMKPGFIGEIPDWVEKYWYFKACCKDGIITALKSSRDKDIQETADGKTGDTGRAGEQPSKANTPPDTGAEKPSADESNKDGKDGKKGKG